MCVQEKEEVRSAWLQKAGTPADRSSHLTRPNPENGKLLLNRRLNLQFYMFHLVFVLDLKQFDECIQFVILGPYLKDITVPGH